MINNGIIIIILAVFALLWLLLMVFVIGLYRNLKKMTSSFAKLGYIAREDTKKYFDESSDKAYEMNKQISEDNKKAIVETMEQVLKNSSVLVKETIAEAEKDASKIIENAQFESANIKKEAKEESGKIFLRLIDDSTQAVDWAMEQYLKENYSMKDHEEIIEKLINIYVNEYKKS